MTAFQTKLAPTSEKLRGGYYTPAPIASFLADWITSAGQRALEPSCGDGAILGELGARALDVTGIEIDAAEATTARVLHPNANVVTADFFEWFGADQHGQWDAVAGNPPFIRFQHWTEPTRSAAFEVMRSVGMRPTKLTNAWVPFVASSTLALRPGGRLGLVVPAELLQVSYASELRAFLVDEFAELTVITFRRLVFDAILQEVVLLLGVRGRGPAAIKVVELDDVEHLPALELLTTLPSAPALQHEREKWTKYFLDPTEIQTLRRVLYDGTLNRLSDVASVDVGVVTGRNQFFVLKPSAGQELQLMRHLRPLVSKSAHLRGIHFDRPDLTELESNDAPCRLLAVDNTDALDNDRHLRAYVAAGEEAEVHKGYKCSIRKQWWVVPSVWTPDAFLLRQIHDHPRVIANTAGATSTDTIHRVRMLNGTPPSKLAAASVNSATFAFAEIMGRSYGGGVLELEPTEAESLPFPSAHGLSELDVASVDHMLRSGRLSDALDHVDETLLVGHHGMDRADVAVLRGAWERLRDRRLARGRKAS